MKRLLAVFLLILWLSPAYSLPSTPAKSEWPLCFSESEWASLEAQVWEETERTVKEAVEAAVAPYKAKIEEQAGFIVKLNRQGLWLKIGLGVSVGAALGLGLYAVLK